MNLEEEIIVQLAKNKFFELNPEKPEYSWTELRNILSTSLDEKPNSFGVKLTRVLNRLKDEGLIEHPYRGSKYSLSNQGRDMLNEIISRSENNAFKFRMGVILPEFVENNKLISYNNFISRYIEVHLKREEPNLKHMYYLMKESLEAEREGRSPNIELINSKYPIK